MSQTMTLSDLAHAIEDREAVKRDLIVNPDRLRVTPATDDQSERLVQSGELQVPLVEPMRITELAHEQIAGWTPIGRRYYQHMREEQPELWAENVNTWLDEGEKPRMLRMQQIPGNGGPELKLRAFLSDQFGRYEDIHLLTPVLERIHDRGWEVLHCALTEKRMHVRVGFPTMRGEVKVGDEVQAGAAFTNSEVGFSMWKSEFFVERLVCLNGMKFTEKFAGFSKRHITGRQAPGWLSASTLALENALLQSQIGDTLDMMNDRKEFDRVLSLMRDTTEQEIEQPMEAVRVLARRTGLSQNEREGVERELVKGGDPTLWGLVNALTATARDVGDFDRRADLEAEAGKLMTNRASWQPIIEAEAAVAA
jgi:hypothetical protein